MGKGTPTNLFGSDWFSWSSSWNHWGSNGSHGAPKPGPSGNSGNSGGTTGPTTTLTVTFNSEEAGYANAMGWYNARTGEAGILFKNTNDDGWNAGVKAGDQRSLTVLQSDVDANNIGFFLIPNGANELSSSLLSSTMKFQVGSNGDGKIVIDRQYGSDVVLSGSEVLFSNQVHNKGDYDYVSGKVGTEGQTKQQKMGSQSDGPDGILGTMAWDDQAMNSCGGTDRDFNDVVFTVTKSGGTNPPTNGAPTDINLSSATINENVAGGVIGMLSTVDPNAGDKHTYSVSDSRFEVVNGQLKLTAGTSLNYENGSSVQLKVTTTDQGGLSYSENFTIAVKNVNEAPTDISISNLSVNENASGAVVGKLSTVDPDAGNTHSYTITGDDRFEVVGGQLKLKSGASLDYETQSSVQLKITTTDQGGLSYSENFTVKVNDVNEAPSNSAPTDIKISNTSINENVAGGIVGILSTVDPNVGNTHTYTVDDDRFEVVSGQLKLKSGMSLDHEAASSVQLKVTTTDQGGLSYSETLTIAVNDVNEAPGTLIDKDAASNTVSEMAAVGAVVGITASSLDPDAGDSLTYSLSNNPGGLFAVNSTTGVVTVAGGLDYETATQHTITVRATDGSGGFSETDFTIQVGDATQVAVDGYISGATVFADANGNGVRDTGEAFTSTDAFGRFEINSNGAPLVMAGGYDIAKSLSFQGKLTAEAGSAVITPLTTLVVELGKAGVPNPNATLASALGMAGANFGQLDPIATAATSITAFARSNQVLNTVTMVANLLLGGNAALGLERTMAAAFAMLAAQAADGALDLGDTTTLGQLINNTANNLGLPGLDGELVTAAATVVAASNGAIDDIAASGGSTDSLLTQITAASIVAQVDASLELKLAGQFGDPEGLVDSFTGSALTSQIEFAENQVANVHGTGTVGSNGDDVMSGNGGVHTFVGGGGKDTLSGGTSNDLLYGDAGDDVLNGQDDEDRLTGGAGNDKLNGGLGADIYIHSGTAADGNDVVNAGDDGFDRVIFNTADLQDLNYMRDGNDLVIGATHSGGPEFDGSVRVVNHYAGASIFFAKIDTSNNLDFGADPDIAQFFFTTDLANGLENDDAAEVLLGGNANEVINGNGGYYDAIFGGGGNDLITGGGGGVDNLNGGSGNDVISAGMGDDSLTGGSGNDVLSGGDGSDTFLFDLSQSGADTLTDFDGASDILSFTGVPDTNANGADLNDLLALVSGITNFGAGNDVVVTFTTGASLTLQGAGASGTLGFTDLVANPATQIRVA